MLFPKTLAWSEMQISWPTSSTVGPKALFSIVIKPRCWGGRYPAISFSGFLHLPLICTLWCWVLSKEASRTNFWVFGMTRPGIEPLFPGSLPNTLIIMPIARPIFELGSSRPFPMTITVASSLPQINISTQPTTSRMWHKVNFKWSNTGLNLQFSFF